ncbi:probable methyltransferase-like protein 25 isoform X5 [Mus musculus]|nr:probable methyltransferase-like protein 25 isoform X5 [Mus musculus]
MNTKKSHEVQAMSELICSIADYCGLKQIIDVGSGKGYLSSFLSLKYGLNVYGIDSSNTNTHGAKERNRKLKKHWSLYHPHSRADANGWASERPRELKVPKGVECKGDAESVQRSRLGNPDLSATDGLPDFSGSAISVIRKQQKNVLAQPAEEENLYFEDAFSLIDFLPVDAIEPTSSQVQNTEKSGLRKERRNTASKDCLMVGLHTCGDLAPSTLRIFTSKAEVKAVCSVGCCYHLLSEEFENQHKDRCANENWGFPMCHYLKEERWCCGRNARMSACLALQRVAVGQGLPTESLFYRAVLQNIIKDYYGISKCEQHVGKIYSKCSSFLEYVRMSLKKLGLDESKRHFQELQSVCCVLCSRWEQNLLDVFYVRLIYDRPGCSLCPMVGFLNVSEEIIMDYYENYKPRMNELEAFNMLKVVLAPCIETLILLDRLCYLKEQDGVAWSALVKLFDPVQSPRCYAVIALKKQCDRG